MKRPYRRMECPVATCTSLKGVRQRGTVPGIKRHVELVHGKDVYEKLDRQGKFGALYDGASTTKTTKPKKRKPKPSSNGPVSEQSIDDLRKLARSKGIDPAGLRKAELVEKLT